MPLNTIESFNGQVDSRFSQSVEKVSPLTPSSNAVTINPNEASLFHITCSSNTTISISAVDNRYVKTGSSLSILLERSSNSIVITWPNNIVWKGNTAPELTAKDMIILTTFGDGSTTTWYGSCISLVEFD